jgi:hypothetical protein
LSSGDIKMSETLAELAVKIIADASELKRALKESERDVQQTGKTLERETKSWQEQFKAVGKIALGVGASITAAMTGIIMSFTKTGSELYDLSLKTGVSAKALAGLQYAAEQGGTSLGTVEMAIKRVASAMSDAESSTSASAQSFAKLGISLSDLQGLNPEEQFLKIASAIAEIPNPMTKSAIAVDLFGRSGTDMLPMLADGADGLKKMMEQGQKLTGWTEEGTKSADDFGDAISTIKTASQGLFNAIASALAPTLKDLADKIVGLVSGFADWAKAHPELAKQIGLVTLAVGGFLTVAGTLMMLAPAIAAAWTIAMGPVGIIVAAVAGLIAALVLVWTQFNKTKDRAKQLTTALKAELEKQKADIQKTLADETALAQSAHDKNIQAIKDEYGEYEEAAKDKITLARQASEAARKALESELDYAREAHDEKISLLEAEYDQKIKTINAEADAQINGIQGQIDAIDEQTQQEELALKRQRQQERINDLFSAIQTAQAYEERQAAVEEYNDYVAEVQRDIILDEREAQKEGLQQQIELIRTNAQEKADLLNTELETRIANEDSIYQAIQNSITLRDAALDGALERELIRIATERDAVIKAEEDKLAAIIDTATAAAAIKTGNAEAATEAEIEGVGSQVEAEKQEASKNWFKYNFGSLYNLLASMGIIKEYASGGLVTRPTLAMVGESGPELITPVSELGQNNNQPIQNNLYLDGALFAQIVSAYQDREYRAQMT